MRRDRGARRLRPPGRADRKPRADGLHGPEAAVAAEARARDLQADRARDAAQGLRAAAADRGAGDRRRRRVRDAVAGRGAAALERRGALDPRGRPGVAADRARVAGRLRPHERRGRGRGGRRRPGRGRARRRRRPAGAAERGHGHVRRRLRRAARIPRRPAGPRPRLLPRRARRLAPDGRDALGRGLAGVAAQRRRRRLLRADGRGREVGTGDGGSDVPALSDRRADAARRPGRARRVHGPRDPARPRRAYARRVGRRRVRAARLLRPRGRGRARPRVRRWRALGAVAEDRGVGAGDPARAVGRGRGRGLRRGAARRRRRRALVATSTRPSRRACAPIPRCSPSPNGSTRTESCGSATGRFTRLCRQLRRRHPDDGHAGSDRPGGTRPPRPPLHVRALDRRQSRPRSVRRPDARARRSRRLRAQAGGAGRLGRLAARRRPDPVGRLGG